MKVNDQEQTRGLVLGLVGVMGFSLTLPALRVAVAYLDPFVLSTGRAVLAAAAAGFYLFITRANLPAAKQMSGLLIVAAGGVLAFPILTAWAMQSVPASHGGVVLGITPLATAMAGALFFGERPTAKFWYIAAAGAVCAVAFSLRVEGGPVPGHLALFGALMAAALGYSRGAALAREMGGLRVICWALVLALPISLPAFFISAYDQPLQAPWNAWAAFAYTAFGSQLIAFAFWYRGLALGGIPRVSQVQLLQPFLTLVASAFLLNETMTWNAVGFAGLILLLLLFLPAGTRTPIRPSLPLSTREIRYANDQK